MDMQTVIKLELTLEEVNGIAVALGDLPTKTNAFMFVIRLVKSFNKIFFTHWV